MQIFYYDENGYLIGKGVADADPMQPGAWLIPAQATEKEPPKENEGFHSVFVNGLWWSKPKEQKVPETIPKEPTATEIQRGEILMKLSVIDRESVRPSRAVALAILAGQQPDAADVQGLTDLENEAIALRAELRSLQ